jgi:cytochrome P450
MIHMNFFLLIIAEKETTRNALPDGLQALCEHPEQIKLFRRDPSLFSQSIAEILSRVTPVMQFNRTAISKSYRARSS